MTSKFCQSFVSLLLLIAANDYGSNIIFIFIFIYIQYASKNLKMYMYTKSNLKIVKSQLNYLTEFLYFNFRIQRLKN
jgi:hypothetical protein